MGQALVDETPLAILVAIFVTTAAPIAHADDKRASLADLKALIGQHAYEEAYLHLGDIPPARRSADWLDVAASAAGGVLATLADHEGTTLAAIDRIDRDYPQIVKLARYAGPRGELGLQGLEGCLRTSDGSDACVTLGLRFVDNAGDRGLAVKAAKVVRRGAGAAASVPFFKRALAGSAAAVCKDDDLRLATVAGLGLTASDGKVGDAQLLMTTCWDQVKGAVIDAFDHDPAGGSVHQNACETLRARRVLSGLQAKQCRI
jgi:hypothetical protein